MQNIITIDKNKCLQDHICIRECPLCLLEKDAEGYPTPVTYADILCVDCGHCVVVCPEGALNQRNTNVTQCSVINSSLNISPEQAEQWLASRRSVRQYKQKTVEPEKINRLLHAASYAPSGHNVQPAKWLLISGNDKTEKVAGITADWMRGVINDMPELAKSMQLERVVAAWEKNKDMILRSAPHLLIGYAPKNERRAPAAIVTAIAYIELLAPVLGLGTCWAGFFTAASQTYEQLQKAVALPAGQAVYGALMLGYPKVKYYRIPTRKPVDLISH